MTEEGTSAELSLLGGRRKGREGEEKEGRKEGIFIFFVLIVVKIHII